MALVFMVHLAFAFPGMNVYGTVTKSVYTETHRSYIEIDEKKYMLMPDCIVFLNRDNKTGYEGMGTISISSIHKNDKVVAFAQARRIYRIEVFR